MEIDGSPAREESGPPQRLGVLIVSGLSEPKRGGALIRAADALRASLDRWATSDDKDGRERREQRFKVKAARDKAQGAERAALDAELAAIDAAPVPIVTVRDVVLSPEGETPAHLRLSFQGNDGSPPACEGEWYLTESWWAGDFQPPSVSALTSWVLKVAPIVVLRHFTQGLRRRWRDRRGPVWPFRVLAAFMRFVLAPILAVVAIAAALVLVLLASLPVPKLSAAIRGATARLSSLIGDSYVLLESPTRFGAVTRRVERDLDWLKQRCDRVAVVAEGQGAIVAHRCLRARAGDDVALFVSVGSGLRKMAELEHMARTRTGVAIGWAVSLLTFALLLCLAVPLVVGGEDALAVSLSLAMYVLIYVWLAINSLLSTTSDEEPQLQTALELVPGSPGPRWVDFFASADPVPNGPVLERAHDWIESREVWSTASILSDHRSYWSNSQGFVLPLSRLLLEAAEAPEIARTLALGPEAIRAAARRRAWRVGWLVGVRSIIAVAALIAGVQLWSDLELAAASIAEHAPAWVKSAVTTVFKPFHDLLDLLGLTTTELIAAALIAAGAGLLFAAVRIAWSAWDRHEVAQAFRRAPFDLGGPLAGLTLAIAAWGCIVLLQAAWFGSWDAYTRWLEADNRLYHMSAFSLGVATWAAVCLTAFVAAGFGWGRWLVGRLRGRRDPTPPTMDRLASAIIGACSDLFVVTTLLLVFPLPLSDDPDAVWPLFVFPLAWALLRPLLARATARPRADLRQRIIARSLRDNPAPRRPIEAALPDVPAEQPA